MGNHVEPRHALPSGPVRALQNAALPAVLLLVVGLIVYLSPGLRGGDQDPVDSRAASGPADEPTTDSPASRPERNRAGKQLAFRAEIVQATRFAKLPTIPASWVRVRRPQTLPTTFTTASYNVLGYSHTTRGGDKPGYADGHTRIRMAVGQLRAQGVSVVGLQEFQMPQAYTFASAAADFDAYPGTSGDNRSVQNSIAWDTSVWRLIESGTTPIPYFSGNRIPMPHVLLQHRVTGQRVWFANYHNPADKFGSAERWRDLATSMEVALVNQLQQQHPVVMTGDMNEREEFLCRVATGAGMHSANGGYADSSGCHWPRPTKVDWIVGTAALQFSGYLAIDSRVSDHPLLVSDATIAAQYGTRGCKTTPASRSRGAMFCPPR